ncbi:MAG: hypothetical protein ABIO70_21165 [Pseudomonadota bacterium]
MTSVDLVAAEIRAGALMVLQRVPRNCTAACIAAALPGGVAVDAPAPPMPNQVRVFDARLVRDFSDWDRRRAELGTPDSPLVVLLDVVSARTLLRAAPQACSWAGGVRLPAERTVRGARSEEELTLGARALVRALQENPEFSEAHAGLSVGVDILSERLFVGRRDAGILDLARENLDEGIVYLAEIPRAGG